MALLSHARSLALPRIDRRVAVGALLAALAAGLVLKLTRTAPTTPVLVAGADLPAGQPLGDLDLDVRRVESAAGLVVGDSVGDLADWVLRVPLAAGEPLVPSLLAPPEVLATPEAFALTLDRSHAVQGRLAAGDRVDVLVTVSAEPGSPPETYTVAQDVYVLDAEVGSTGFEAGEVAVLLAVDTAVAEKLANAREWGTIDLVRVSP